MSSPRFGFRSGALAILVAGAGFLAGAPLAAQDTLQVADTLTRPAAVSPGDTAVADSLSTDSLPVHALPPVPGFRLERDAALIARWDEDQLLRTRALSLLELLAELPGTVPLRTSDYGSPEGIVFDGMAGGRLRVLVDGIEETAIDGSVVDLAQVSLVGMASVAVVRAGGEIRILMTTRQATEVDPMSTIEAGTGDLDTNVFRGTFLHPNAFGGGLTLLFERTDSDGPGRSEAGSLQGVSVRYLRPIGDRLTLSGELRNRKVESLLARTPGEVSRLTRSVRLRLRITDDVVAEAFATENKLDLSSDTTLFAFPRNAQYGGTLGWDLGATWGRASWRYIGRAGPATLMRGDLDVGASSEAVGGFSARVGWDREVQVNRMVYGASAWTRPVLGLSLHGSFDTGPRAWLAPSPPLGGVADSIRVGYPRESDATRLRAGARFERGPVRLEGAWLRTEVDSVLPLGNRVDLGTRAFPGDEASGFELSGRIGLPVPGFALEGSLQQWETEGFYRPGRIYRGGLSFHDLFYPTGNLEITASALVEGRDPMLLPLEDPASGLPARVPFYQSWNVYLQIRVVTVRVFIRWDNLSLRTNNQDIPGRVLPRTRAMYGVRWTLRN